MRYAAAAPTTPTRPIPATRVVGEPWSGVVLGARAVGGVSVAEDAAPEVAPEVDPEAVAEVAPEDAFVGLLPGEVVAADAVLRPDDGVVPALALAVLVPATVVPLLAVARGVEVPCAGVDELVRGVLDGFGVGFGVGDELGFGVLVRAGGAVRGAPPDPNANPMTVPGAGL